MKWINLKITVNFIVVRKNVPPIKISYSDFIMHVNLIVQAHEILSKNENGYEDH